jgi:hypothetical protein
VVVATSARDLDERHVERQQAIERLPTVVVVSGRPPDTDPETSTL